MRALVTGGAGFIGSHLAELLLAEGWRVAVLDDLSTGRRENVPHGATFFQVDLVETERVKDAVRGFGPDIVFHQAAQASVVRSWEDPIRDAQVNLVGLLSLLSACLGSGVKGLVFASSGGVLYGDAEVIPTPEAAAKNPLSPYGVAKLASEHYLFAFQRAYGLPYIALRYGNVYGPRQDPFGEAGVVAIFGRAMLAGQAPTVYGDGRQTRDFVYVGDVARANLLAAQALLSGFRGGSLDEAAFNVGSGKETSVLEIFQALVGLTGFPGEPRFGKARPGEVRRSALDGTRAARVLGFRPRVSFQEGLSRTVDWLRKPS
ncbi:MAG: UDP-glucose 4-epimerase [Acetothermia bacterium 64_32]|nr:MAG: UDP-glucose 4-epimerase [Acetothermia bacterium 64_32]HAF70144.1 UDP-glucose 4-epimerase [Candidatus Acetothermia bacterium]